ncbi:Inner membrane protein YrbG, predicted calcium/sodium:proton antiporter [hydrothermal vent metagenome]|uniref:Inner membrane protein YrbG, predicted calcium/sodium:proton antiporter n=1 Tax=hydrothermal vent metagenome TaxID=652676 RepID=A0A3B1AEX7_9ZZZZ
MLMQLLYPLFAITGGFFVLLWGADRFVMGGAASARCLGVSPMIIGLTIIGFGTSAPEILVSIIAALDGAPNLAIGNALGSNITNIALVIGVTAIVTPLLVKSEILKREYPIMFSVMLLALVLMWDLHLSFTDGIILIVGLFLILGWMIKMGLDENKQSNHTPQDPLEDEFESEIPKMSLGKALFWLALGFALLLVSSKVLVWGAVEVAHFFGVSDLIIGLTIVALGTSLPELAATVVSALKGEHDLAIGNIIGSNIFNLLAVIGIPALIVPIQLEEAVLQRDFLTMIGLSVALFIMAYGFKNAGRVNRLEGFLLVSAYIGYLSWLYISITA